jgi:hypothetical protein
VVTTEARDLLDFRALKRIRNEASRALAELVRMEKDLRIPSLQNHPEVVDLLKRIDQARINLKAIASAMEPKDETSDSR